MCPRLRFRIATLAALLAALAGPRSARGDCDPSGTVPEELLGQSGCHLVALGITPLVDMGCGTYQGFEGGLYPGGLSAPPSDHATAGAIMTGGVVPRRPDGEPDSVDGRIGFASIGMSNTWAEFVAFQGLAASAGGLHPRLVIVNGAQGGRPAEDWAQPGSTAWSVLDQRLASVGLSPAQL
jgi:hypothetical protein